MKIDRTRRNTWSWTTCAGLAWLLAVGAARADSLADDEAAVIAHIKALRDLNSETRATAAAALRQIVAKYPSGTIYLSKKDGGEAEWQQKVNQVMPGMTKAEVLKILPRFAEADDGFVIASGDSHNVSYRLDYHWMVTTIYRNPDKVIERPILTKRAVSVFVAPPKNFTGDWITWHVNGQKGHEIQYKSGRYDGVFTKFHDNGKKSYDQHYANRQAHGPGTGWYADGKASYTIQYRNGKQDGKWIHWYANGKKQSETDYKDGKQDGLEASWRENGHISYEANYKNGVKHGVEASWDENGDLNYEREYKDGTIVER